MGKHNIDAVRRAKKAAQKATISRVVTRGSQHFGKSQTLQVEHSQDFRKVDTGDEIPEVPSLRATGLHRASTNIEPKSGFHQALEGLALRRGSAVDDDPHSRFRSFMSRRQTYALARQHLGKGEQSSASKKFQAAFRSVVDSSKQVLMQARTVEALLGAQGQRAFRDQVTSTVRTAVLAVNWEHLVSELQSLAVEVDKIQRLDGADLGDLRAQLLRTKDRVQERGELCDKAKKLKQELHVLDLTPGRDPFVVKATLNDADDVVKRSVHAIEGVQRSIFLLGMPNGFVHGDSDEAPRQLAGLPKTRLQFLKASWLSGERTDEVIEALLKREFLKVGVMNYNLPKVLLELHKQAWMDCIDVATSSDLEIVDTLGVCVTGFRERFSCPPSPAASGSASPVPEASGQPPTSSNLDEVKGSLAEIQAGLAGRHSAALGAPGTESGSEGLGVEGELRIPALGRPSLPTLASELSLPTWGSENLSASQLRSRSMLASEWPHEPSSSVWAPTTPNGPERMSRSSSLRRLTQSSAQMSAALLGPDILTRPENPIVRPGDGSAQASRFGTSEPRGDDSRTESPASPRVPGQSASGPVVEPHSALKFRSRSLSSTREAGFEGASVGRGPSVAFNLREEIAFDLEPHMQRESGSALGGVERSGLAEPPPEEPASAPSSRLKALSFSVSAEEPKSPEGADFRIQKTLSGPGGHPLLASQKESEPTKPVEEPEEASMTKLLSERYLSTRRSTRASWQEPPTKGRSRQDSFRGSESGISPWALAVEAGTVAAKRRSSRFGLVSQQILTQLEVVHRLSVASERDSDTESSEEPAKLVGFDLADVSTETLIRAWEQKRVEKSRSCGRVRPWLRQITPSRTASASCSTTLQSLSLGSTNCSPGSSLLLPDIGMRPGTGSNLLLIGSTEVAPFLSARGRSPRLAKYSDAQLAGEHPCAPWFPANAFSRSKANVV